MDTELIVYLSERRIGVLSQKLGRLTFAYDRDWLTSPERHPERLAEELEISHSVIF